MARLILVLKERCGATTAEYALILATVAAALFAATLLLLWDTPVSR